MPPKKRFMFSGSQKNKRNKKRRQLSQSKESVAHLSEVNLGALEEDKNLYKSPDGSSAPFTDDPAEEDAETGSNCSGAIHPEPEITIKVEVISPPSPEFILCDAFEEPYEDESGYTGDKDIPSNSITSGNEETFHPTNLSSALPEREKVLPNANFGKWYLNSERLKSSELKEAQPAAGASGFTGFSILPDKVSAIPQASMKVSLNGEAPSKSTIGEVNPFPAQLFQNTASLTADLIKSIRPPTRHLPTNPSVISGAANITGTASKQLKNFYCSRCIKWFAKERHFWSHTCEPGSFICDVCGERMLDEKSLREHLEPKTCGICKDCGKEFSDARAMKAHRLLSHPEGATYKCSVCKISFDRLFSLTNHIRRIHAKKRFDCDICGKVMADAQALESHQAENTCAKCKNCGEVFSDLSSFRAHKMVAHIDKPVHKCCFCEYSFSKLTNLTYHIRKAHAQKTYDCSFCGEKTLDPESLKTHESAKLCGKCLDCGKHYPNFAALKAHRLIAHPEGANFKCNICLRCFKTDSGLTMHIRRGHNKF